MAEVISHKKNILLPIPEQDDSITLESLLYAKFFGVLKRKMKERVALVDVLVKFMKPLFLEVHQNYFLFVLLVIPPQQYTVKPQLRCFVVFIWIVSLEIPLAQLLTLLLPSSIVMEVVYQLTISIAFY